MPVTRMLLAAFSDDGVTIDIKDETTNTTTAAVLSRRGTGQALPLLSQSLRAVNYEFIHSHNYTITIHYLNTYYTGAGDIDGVTLIAYAGEEDCCEITAVTPSKDPVAVGTAVTFTAQGPEGACLEDVSWTGGGDPANNTGATLTTTWTTTGTKTVTARCPGGEANAKSVTVVDISLVLVSGATMLSNGTAMPERTKACADIRDSEDVLLQVVFTPALPEGTPFPNLSWDGGSSVAGDPSLRKVSKSSFKKEVVTVTFETLSYSMYVYIVGAEYDDFRPRPGNNPDDGWDASTSPAFIADRRAGPPTGRFGPHPSTGVFRSVMQLRFKVKPDALAQDAGANILKRSDFKWNLTRERRSLFMVMRPNGVWQYHKLPHESPGNGTSQWVNDDYSQRDKDLDRWDTNICYIFDSDRPGIPSPMPYTMAIIYYHNFRQWCTVSILSGSKKDCSDYFYWHAHRTVSNPGTGWQETPPTETIPYINDIGPGFHPFSPLPENAAGKAVILTSTSPLPAGANGTPYAFAFAATPPSENPQATLSFSLVSGELPPGLSLNTNGTLSGTPTQPGDYVFVVMATADIANVISDNKIYQLHFE